jgi:hypothetical protein
MKINITAKSVALISGASVFAASAIAFSLPRDCKAWGSNVTVDPALACR